MARFPTFLLPMAGLTAACSGSEDIYSLQCESAAPAGEAKSPMGFALNEPARQIFWMGPGEILYPVDVASWDDSRITGEYRVGAARVAVNLDRKGNSATLTRAAADGGDLNIRLDSCERVALTAEQERSISDSSD
jgi:hypothetical protein